LEHGLGVGVGTTEKKNNVRLNKGPVVIIYAGAPKRKGLGKQNFE
jgi:hypothetical protein